MACEQFTVGSNEWVLCMNAAIHDGYIRPETVGNYSRPSNMPLSTEPDFDVPISTPLGPPAQMEFPVPIEGLTLGPQVQAGIPAPIPPEGPPPVPYPNTMFMDQGEELPPPIPELMGPPPVTNMPELFQPTYSPRPPFVKGQPIPEVPGFSEFTIADYFDEAQSIRDQGMGAGGQEALGTPWMNQQMQALNESVRSDAINIGDGITAQRGPQLTSFFSDLQELQASQPDMSVAEYNQQRAGLMDTYEGPDYLYPQKLQRPSEWLAEKGGELWNDLKEISGQGATWLAKKVAEQPDIVPESVHRFVEEPSMDSLDQMYNNAGPEFQENWDQLTPEEQKVLKASGAATLWFMPWGRAAKLLFGTGKKGLGLVGGSLKQIKKHPKLVGALMTYFGVKNEKELTEYWNRLSDETTPTETTPAETTPQAPTETTPTETPQVPTDSVFTIPRPPISDPSLWEQGSIAQTVDGRQVPYTPPIQPTVQGQRGPSRNFMDQLMLAAYFMTPVYNKDRSAHLQGGLEMMAKMREKKKVDSPFGKINPKDFTPESFKAFNNSCLRGACNHTLLRAKDEGETGWSRPSVGEAKTLVYDILKPLGEDGPTNIEEVATRVAAKARAAKTRKEFNQIMLSELGQYGVEKDWIDRMLGGAGEFVKKPQNQKIAVGSPCTVEGRTAGGGRVMCQGGIWVKK